MGEVSFIGFRAMDALTSVNRIHVVSGTFYLILSYGISSLTKTNYDSYIQITRQ